MTDLQEVPSPFARGGDCQGLPDEILASLDDNRARLYLDLEEKIALEKVAADNLKVAVADVAAIEAELSELNSYVAKAWPRGSDSDERTKLAKRMAEESQAMRLANVR